MPLLEIAVNGTAEPINCSHSPFSSSGKAPQRSVAWADVCLTVFFILAGSLGNGLVIWILGFRLKRGGFLTFVLNLAVADFGFCVVPCSQIPIFLASHDYVYGLGVCQVEQYLTRGFFYAGTLFIASICLDRCLAIQYPLWHKLRRPQRTPAFICAVVWLVAGGMAALTPINLELEHIRCLGPRCRVKSSKAVQLIANMELVLAFLLPLCVIVTCSAFIVHKVATESRVGRQRGRVNSTVCITVLLFLLCWTPFQVAQYLFQIQNTFFPDNKSLGTMAAQAGHYCSYLFFVNSCLNPFIYLLMGREVKKRMRVSVQCLGFMFQRAFTDSCTEGVSSTSSTLSAGN
ncbi:C3a anaphylatoxin chemotactic receptor-like [Megalops cyprinoides]|uniref:C3a anaphylatoxin chemotactic receptor-like n=1 Tax=Megalops cyprinoides TaxID=118141 RepID=UPI0018655A42|nr:C3a anaphylatoxin chemotactic receptor-like [Megalops cyprinoides]